MNPLIEDSELQEFIAALGDQKFEALALLPNHAQFAVRVSSLKLVGPDGAKDLLVGFKIVRGWDGTALLPTPFLGRGLAERLKLGDPDETRRLFSRSTGLKISLALGLPEDMSRIPQWLGKFLRVKVGTYVGTDGEARNSVIAYSPLPQANVDTLTQLAAERAAAWAAVPAEVAVQATSSVVTVTGPTPVPVPAELPFKPKPPPPPVVQSGASDPA